MPLSMIEAASSSLSPSGSLTTRSAGISRSSALVDTLKRRANMYKSIFTIVGLCFVISAAAAAHDPKVPDAAQLTDGEIAYIYLQANHGRVRAWNRPRHGTRSKAARRDGGQ